ncbi:MAG: hypothetical protein ACHBN1_00580 [Heteroscytonema crispum UTEX LB 1556]
MWSKSLVCIRVFALMRKDAFRSVKTGYKFYPSKQKNFVGWGVTAKKAGSVSVLSWRCHVVEPNIHKGFVGFRRLLQRQLPARVLPVFSTRSPTYN